VRFTCNYNRLQSNVAFLRTNVASVVGGVVGGVVGLLTLLGLAFFCFRRRRRQHLQTLNERPNPFFLPQSEARFTNTDPASIDPFASAAALSASRPSGTSRPLQSWSDSEVGFTPSLAARDASNPNAMTNFSHVRATSSANDNATSSVPVPIGVAAAAATTTSQVSYPNEKSRPAPGGGTLQQDPTARLDVPSARPNAVLTDDQADFVNSLFNNNVPAPVVARVLERMIANPQGSSSTGFNDPELRPHLNRGNLSTLLHSQAAAGGVAWQPTLGDLGDGETTVGTAPPSYDYVLAQ
jgi:MYXO-CTERM domain-containing protein